MTQSVSNSFLLPQRKGVIDEPDEGPRQIMISNISFGGGRSFSYLFIEQATTCFYQNLNDNCNDSGGGKTLLLALCSNFSYNVSGVFL